MNDSTKVKKRYVFETKSAVILLKHHFGITDGTDVLFLYSMWNMGA